MNRYFWQVLDHHNGKFYFFACKSDAKEWIQNATKLLHAKYGSRLIDKRRFGISRKTLRWTPQINHDRLKLLGV